MIRERREVAKHKIRSATKAARETGKESSLVRRATLDSVIILAATPIGNLGDASRRLVEALESATVIAAEDTRVASKLLSLLLSDDEQAAHHDGKRVQHDDKALQHGGRKTRPRTRIIALHDHNERERAAELVELARETDVLVLSDAGMPTVSDPGYHLVNAAIAAGVRVSALPGPSAVLTALAVSGLPTDRFAFEGFVPRKKEERRSFFAALATESRTLVFFESPKRLATSLAALAESFGPERRLVVCRELTKLHEEIRRGTAAELAGWAAAGQVRGEIVLVVAGFAPEAADADSLMDASIEKVLRRYEAGTPLKAAVNEVTSELAADAALSPGPGASSVAATVPKRALYEAVLARRAAAPVSAPSTGSRGG